MINVCEMPSNTWSFEPTFALKIDRSEVTVADYLEERKIKWLRGYNHREDIHIHIFKEGAGSFNARSFGSEIKRCFFNRPYMSLIGEPRELAPAAYFFARPGRTMATAPGSNLDRLYYASEWRNPKLDGWLQRIDRICWIARPTPDRIAFAIKLIDSGIPLDIYSLKRWPVENWKGYAEDEITTSEKYRYRIVSENSCKHGYHSEKMFNSIRSGCVTFYHGDPSLDLTYAKGAYLPMDFEHIRCRLDHSPAVLEQMDDFMFSDSWEIYSFKKFYGRIIDMAERILD